MTMEIGMLDYQVRVHEVATLTGLDSANLEKLFPDLMTRKLIMVAWEAARMNQAAANVSRRATGLLAGDECTVAFAEDLGALLFSVTEICTVLGIHMPDLARGHLRELRHKHEQEKKA